MPTNTQPFNKLNADKLKGYRKRDLFVLAFWKMLMYFNWCYNKKLCNFIQFRTKIPNFTYF